MGMIDLITAKEMEMMADHRLDCAGNGEDELCYGITPAPMSQILAPWTEAKGKLFKLFGEQLILTRKFEYVKPENEIMQELYDLDTTSFGRKNRKASDFYQAYDEIVNEAWNKAHSISDWESEEYCKAYNIASGLGALMGANTLYSNTYVGNNFDIVDKNTGKTITISRGMKAIKAIGKVAKAYNLEGFEDFRICHSQIIGQSKINGEMCISIHPFDYWTMSDNNSGWSSCMSWLDCGEYRQGTVEMMNSPTVIVAYMKSNEDMELDCGIWNNKKWRQLFVVDEKCIVAVKPYPNENDEATNFVLNWLKELAEKTFGWTYIDEIQKFNKITGKGNKIGFEDGTFSAKEFYFNSGHMYSDFNSYSSKGYFSNNLPLSDNNKNYISIQYSGVPECVICGSIHNIDYDAHLACPNCLNITSRCEECGSNYEVYEFNGHHYCADCWSSFIKPCEVCEEEVHYDDAHIVRIIPRYDEKDLLEINKSYGWSTSIHRYKTQYNAETKELLIPDDTESIFFDCKDCFYNWLDRYVKEDAKLMKSGLGDTEYYIFADEVKDNINSELVYRLPLGYANRELYFDNKLSLNEAMIKNCVLKYHCMVSIADIHENN